MKWFPLICCLPAFMVVSSFRYKEEIKLNFKSGNATSVEYKIPPNYADYHLSVEQIKKRKEHTFFISNTSYDSISIHFPPGGTSTSVHIYKITKKGEQKYYNSISILFGGEPDYFTFSKKDAGRYLIRYSSCHWGKKFWLSIK